jgi:hypothetical protein
MKSIDNNKDVNNNKDIGNNKDTDNNKNTNSYKSSNKNFIIYVVSLTNYTIDTVPINRLSLCSLETEYVNSCFTAIQSHSA